MDDGTSQVVKTVDKSPPLGEVRGAALISILILFIAEGCHNLATRRAFLVLDADALSTFIPSLLISVLFLSYYVRYWITGLWLCGSVSLFGCVAAFSARSWGDRMVDGTEQMRRDYHKYSFMAESLSALGFSLLLTACVVLLVLSRKSGKA